MPQDICGIRIRREEVHFEGGLLHVGHEWIEFLDANGTVTSSAGFWPDSWWPLTAGQVFKPDPMHGDTKATTYTVEVFPLPGEGDGIDDCEDASCADIVACVTSTIDNDKAKPPMYSMIFFNCHDWVSRVLENCCLTVSV